MEEEACAPLILRMVMILTLRNIEKAHLSEGTAEGSTHAGKAQELPAVLLPGAECAKEGPQEREPKWVGPEH